MVDEPITHAAYTRFLDAGQLMGSRSAATGKLYVPPRPICPDTFSDAMTWEPLSGAGTVVALTDIHIGLSAMAAEGYDRNNPYTVAIVALDEGASVSGLIVSDAPVAIGTRVRAHFPPAAAGGRRLAFAAEETG